MNDNFRKRVLEDLIKNHVEAKPDLIERLKEWYDDQKQSRVGGFYSAEVEDAIAALSPVLPDEVAELRKRLQSWIDSRPDDVWSDMCSMQIEVQDLLEKLARENEMLTIEANEKGEHVTALYQHIAELEEKKNQFRDRMTTYYGRCERLDAALEEIGRKASEPGANWNLGQACILLGEVEEIARKARG